MNNDSLYAQNYIRWLKCDETLWLEVRQTRRVIRQSVVSEKQQETTVYCKQAHKLPEGWGQRRQSSGLTIHILETLRNRKKTERDKCKQEVVRCHRRDFQSISLLLFLEEARLSVGWERRENDGDNDTFSAAQVYKQSEA